MVAMDEQQPLSYVTFERTARGVIVPKVKVVTSDADPVRLQEILVRAKAVFSDALQFAEEMGEKP